MKRSDGDMVAHAIVTALAAAVNQGDIDDWFPDQGETGVRSMEYLPQMRRRFIEADQLLASDGRCHHPVRRAATHEEADP